ncbi:type II secretion system F family protein [Desulfosediminicola sp.]|uniref:type II secretion system F family protein n=1 Tax=Desulfosediminicola sp. TaxID=2886825 RepID=UPI003AF281DC
MFTNSNVRSVHKSVVKFSGGHRKEQEIDIYSRRKFSSIAILNSLFEKFPIFHRIDNFLQQTGLNISVAIFILSTPVSGALVFLISTFFIRNTFLSLVLGFFALFLPTIVLKVVGKQRLKKFEALFPDALDLMGYSLRAGHSVMSGLKMVADEMNDPIGPEFSRIVEEVNFGQGMEKALHNFSERVGSNEVKYFATSLIIQRETGGNLAELLDSVATVIRKRFRFREKVRTLSAEGRFSGYFLIMVPFLITGALHIQSPDYSAILYKDPVGPYVIGIGLILMAIGAYVIHKMVQIDL